LDAAKVENDFLLYLNVPAELGQKINGLLRYCPSV
jgi:hypothetical protein